MLKVEFPGKSFATMTFEGRELGLADAILDGLIEVKHFVAEICKEGDLDNERLIADRLNRATQDIYLKISSTNPRRIVEHKIANVMNGILRVAQERDWNDKFPTIYGAMLSRAKRFRHGSTIA